MHDEVKRAYTEQALRWHPDRQVSGDVDSSATAAWHMREVDAAWQVLRSPADRAAYDDQLRRPAASARPTDRCDRVAPSFEGQLVDPQRIDPQCGARRRWGRWVPVLIVVVLVAAGVAVAALVAAHRSAATDEPVVRTNHCEVGSCVAIRPGPIVSVVSCGLPNSDRSRRPPTIRGVA